LNYYTIQVRTHGEKDFIKMFNITHPDVNLPLYFLEKEIRESHKGKFILKKQPLFPGYIFIRLDNEPIEKYQWMITTTKGFGRFLISNQNVKPLSEEDLNLVLQLINNGTVAGISEAYFDINDRIVICQGPLSGQEGRIVKVNKRQGRAKIRLDLYNETFLVDLGFEIIASLNQKPTPAKNLNSVCL